VTANTFGKPSLNIGQDLHLSDGQLSTWLELRQPPERGRQGPDPESDWSEMMNRRTQRDRARTARLEAVRGPQRRTAHRRTAVIVAAPVAGVELVGGASRAVVGATGHAELKDEFWRPTPTVTKASPRNLHGWPRKSFVGGAFSAHRNTNMTKPGRGDLDVSWRGMRAD
jgi:hypothetical protein